MNPTLKRAIKPGIMYVATGQTKCGTILAGDRLFLDDEGRLMNSTASGWLNPGQWERFRCPVVVNVEWYRRELEKHEQMVVELRRVIEEAQP